jgi:hypothetical protein
VKTNTNQLIMVMMISFLSVNALAQPEVSLIYIYDNGRREIFDDIYAASDGGYIMCGGSGDLYTSNDPTRDMLLVRIDADGDELWSGIYGVENHCDNANCVIETDSADFLTCGYYYENNWDAIITALMVNRDGEQIWFETYREGSCQAVIELKDGRFMLAGGSNSQGYLSCIEYNGDLVWEETYGEEQSKFYTMRETDEGVVVAGYNVEDVWVVKVDFNGEVIWSRIYDRDNYNFCHGMISLPDGGFALVGYVYFEEINRDGLFMRIDDEGNLEASNTHEFARDYYYNYFRYLTTTQNGNIIAVGDMGNPYSRSAAAMCLSPNGEERWTNIYEFPGYYRHGFTGVVRDNNDYIAACGWIDSVTRDGLVVKIEPERPQPQFIYYEPEDTVFTVLQGNTVDFLVRVIDQMHRNIEYLWTVGEAVISMDSTAQYDFPDIGECSVKCEVSNGEFTASITWHITVTGMYIAAFTPDTLDLTVRRNSSVDFSIAVRTILEEPVNYAWTYIDRERQREEISNEDSVSYRFIEGGDCWMEAFVWQGDFDDMVTWAVHVRSLVWGYLPLETNLSVPVDSNIDFEVVPFVLGEEDTLRFNWWLDGEYMDFDSTVSAVSVEFGELGEHQMTCILCDTCDTDTVTWLVDVYDPYSDVIPPDDYLPQTLTLYSPSPNPFNASATVRYDLPASGWVKLSLYDLSGRLVAEFVDGEKSAGRHAVELDGSGLAAGVYFIVMKPPLSPPLLHRGGYPAGCLIRKAVIVK